jgi:SAM-dependent methyltransferase
MNRSLSEPKPPLSYEADFREYSELGTVQRYRQATAGKGIEYLLRTTYGPIFLDAALASFSDAGDRPLRAIEFGCGAGMAIHYVTERLNEVGVDVDFTIGADFVPAMIEAAKQDLEQSGTTWARARLSYVVATNEALADEVAKGLGLRPSDLEGTFQLALGLNTFRYPIRHGTAARVVADLDRLLAPGGRVVVIDMNDRFPYGIKPKRRRPDDAAHWLPFLRVGTDPLPTLDEYARPFVDAGFEIERKGYLAWIPHSANGLRYHFSRASSGVLQRLLPTRSMRSLVVARKPT